MSDNDDWTIAKRKPNKPINIYPEDSAESMPLSTSLCATAFESRDLERSKETASLNRFVKKSQISAHWQIRTPVGNYQNSVWDEIITPKDTLNTAGKLVISNKLNEVTLPYGVLKPSSSYYWHIRYQASDDLWSEWSSETQFITSPFTVQPYLQNMTQTSIVVMWEDGEQDGYVEYGLDSLYGQKADGIVKKTEADTFIHEVRIEGLSSETVYHYRVANSLYSSQNATFKTAPHSDAPFTFSVWADSQTGPQVFETLLDRMLDNSIDFAVAVGDMASNGGIYNHVHDYHVGPLSKKFKGKLPWFLTWGSHDGSDRIIYDYVSLPDKSGSYSFNYGNSHFTFLSIHNLDEKHVKWLEADLASSESQNAVFRFFFVHNPPYCILWIDGDKWLRENVVPLLEKYNIDFVFSGHTHDYERGYHNGIYYVVNGGSSWLDTHEPVIGDWDFLKDNMVMDNEFVLISIDGNKLEYKAINGEGDIIDIIHIKK